MMVLCFQIKGYLVKTWRDICNEEFKDKWFHYEKMNIYFKIVDYPDKVIFIEKIFGRFQFINIESIYMIDDYLDSTLVIGKDSKSLDSITAKALLIRKGE